MLATFGRNNNEKQSGLANGKSGVLSLRAVGYGDSWKKNAGT
jgi:hypothetical protein